MTKATDLLLAYENLTWDLYIDLSDDLTVINPLNIEGELLKQAHRFSYYSGLCENAKKDCEILEIELTQCQASARIRGQEECKSSNTRPTGAILDSFINSDESCINITLKLADNKYKLGLLKSLMQALSHKKDMLVQLSANQRTEKGIYS
jgi:hypothetical protein